MKCRLSWTSVAPTCWTESFFDRDELFEEERSAFEVHRSNLPGAFSMTLTRSSMSELLDPYPATELAHSWLRHDLKELGWAR